MGKGKIIPMINSDTVRLKQSVNQYKEYVKNLEEQLSEARSNEYKLINQLLDSQKSIDNLQKQIKEIEGKSYTKNKNISILFNMIAKRINENPELKYALMKLYAESAHEVIASNLSFSAEGVFRLLCIVFGNDEANKIIEEYPRELFELEYSISQEKKSI